MASNFQQDIYDGGYSINGGGYEVEVIENYPSDFNCGICTLLIKDATHGCDNHVFCKSCLQENIDHGIRDEGKVLCPGGCRETIDPSNLQPSKLINRIINKLNSKCKNDSCEWKGDLLDFVQDHQKVCEYSLIPCNNDGCEITVIKKKILQHEKDCLHQIVQCDYCQSLVKKMNKIFRKDETTELTCRSFKQHLAESIEEITRLKHENSETKAQLVELEKKSNEQIIALNASLQIKTNEINQLKDDVKNNMAEIQVLKDINQQSKDVKKKVNLSDGTVKLQEETLNPDLDTKLNSISSLKDRLNEGPYLKLIVSLINDDSVLKINILEENNSLEIKELSKCYEKNDFNYVINKLGLEKKQVLMRDLFHEIPYHLYEYYRKDGDYCQGWLCFPIDFDEMYLEISIPNRFKLKFSKKDCLVEHCYTHARTHNGYKFKYLTLYIGQSPINIQNGINVRFEIRNGYYDQMIKSIGFADWFGEGYACLRYQFL